MADETLSEQTRHYDAAYAGHAIAPGSTHDRVLQEVGAGARVLELGPSTGYMTEALRERGCRVVGIELDAGAAARAAAFAERMIVGDLDDPAVLDELGEERFDAIVAADVLEHLKQPTETLRRLVRHLEPEGRVIASLPNVTHVSVRIALLQGRFPYGPVGLLDRTHLRFYDREAVLRLFEDAGLAVGALHRQRVPLEESSVPFARDATAERLIAETREDPDAQTYQFVAVGHPADSAVLQGLGARLRELRERADGARALADELGALRHTLREQQEEIRVLSERVTQTARREADARALLQSAHEQLLERDRKLQQLLPVEQQLREARAEAERIDGELGYALHRLEGIEQSRAWQAVKAFRRLKSLVKPS